MTTTKYSNGTWYWGCEFMEEGYYITRNDAGLLLEEFSGGMWRMTGSRVGPDQPHGLTSRMETRLFVVL
jgi:hypothetical protein